MEYSGKVCTIKNYQKSIEKEFEEYTYWAQ